MPLDFLGWNARLEAGFLTHREAGLAAARVAREDRDRYVVLDESGARPAVLAGRLRHDEDSPGGRPAVGDWVAVRAGSGSPAVIAAVLPRTSAFLRKVAGGTTEAQVVAANVDTVFLVSGLDGDFNPRRIERYLAAAWESGAAPVIVLNKADVAEDLDARIADVEAVAGGTAVVAVAARDRLGLDALARWLARGRTVALIGSSGVGKSTLVNALLGEERLETGEVRADDSRGRHTTTHRELVLLPSGALLLDTPGMRELQLWGEEEGLETAFPEIAALAEGCRFRDCAHQAEPGCAVLAAAADGSLEGGRLESWRKLQRELRWLASRQDARLRAEEMSRWKAIHKSMRHHPRADRGRK